MRSATWSGTSCARSGACSTERVLDARAVLSAAFSSTDRLSAGLWSGTPPSASTASTACISGDCLPRRRALERFRASRSSFDDIGGLWQHRRRRGHREADPRPSGAARPAYARGRDPRLGREPAAHVQFDGARTIGRGLSRRDGIPSDVAWRAALVATIGLMVRGAKGKAMLDLTASMVTETRG